MFGNLDLDLNFKLIDLKSRDFKSIKFESYFKFKDFKGLKFLVDLSNPNPNPNPNPFDIFKIFKQVIWILITRIQI